MKVVPLRKDGLGIAGTYRNAEHHAQKVIPLIKALEKKIKTCGFAVHKQGHNIHVFETTDGRHFDMIPFFDGESYEGIELRIRKSRSQAERLVVITSLDEVPAFLQMLALLARPLPENQRGQFKHELVG